MDVMQYVKGHIPVTLRRFVVVSQDKGVGDSKVRASTGCEPSNGSNNTLITLFSFDEGRACLVFPRVGMALMGRPEWYGVASGVMQRL